MKEYTLNHNDSGQRLDKYMQKAFPGMPQSLLYKYIRLKRVKVNGKRADPALKLEEGDVLQLYINDELLEPVETQQSWRQAPPHICVVYEDANILLVSKPAGMLCHEGDEDARAGDPTLIDRIKAYLFNKGDWQPDRESSFTPALCNRIDRNTGGIVIAAKTADALREMNGKIRAHEVNKLYLCLVHGTPSPAHGTLEGYIIKDSAKRQVTVLPRPVKGALSAKTGYRVLETRENLSLVECVLHTGRTHQIRAQMAHAGYPLAGDTKYGTAALNRGLPFKFQALYSYKVCFDFKRGTGVLEYLRGRCFEAPAPFFLEYFEKLRKN